MRFTHVIDGADLELIVVSEDKVINVTVSVADAVKNYVPFTIVT